MNDDEARLKSELDKLLKTRGRGLDREEYESLVAEATFKLRLAREKSAKLSRTNGNPHNNVSAH